MDADGIAAALQQLQIHMAQMQAAHAAQIAQLQAAAQAQAPRPYTVRIAAPPFYTGATTLPLDEWFAALRQQFAYYAIAGDGPQVRLAAAHLKDAALDWYQTATAQVNGVDPPAPTWVDFQAGLRIRFQPVTAAKLNMTKLDHLKQGTRHVNDYVAAFRRIMVALPAIDAASAMHRFAAGLHPSLQKVLRERDPATLDECIALVVRSGSSYVVGGSSAMDLNALELAAYGDAPAAAAAPHAAHAVAASDAPVSRREYDTLLAAIQSSSAHRGNGSGSNGRGAQGASGGFHGPRPLPRISGFSEEKVRAYMEKNMCFGCDSLEHRARDCPRRKIVDGRVSWAK